LKTRKRGNAWEEKNRIAKRKSVHFLVGFISSIKNAWNCGEKGGGRGESRIFRSQAKSKKLLRGPLLLPSNVRGTQARKKRKKKLPSISSKKGFILNATQFPTQGQGGGVQANQKKGDLKARSARTVLPLSSGTIDLALRERGLGRNASRGEEGVSGRKG